MSKVLQERGFGNLPSSTKTNPRDQVKSISTTIKVDSYSICRIGSSQYVVSTGQNSKLLYKSRQMTIPFPSHLDYHYCEEEEGNYRLKFTKAYGASHINNAIPQKEKDLGSFTLPCFINNTCFDNALVDLGASKFYNSIMKDKMVYKGDNVVGALLNVPIFVGTFSIVTEFAILEDMDAYRDEGMGDVIVGKPFFREVGIKARQFDRTITIYNSDDEVSEKDKKNGISHAYQKLKGFYKGVLNLGPGYIRNAKMEEWLTRGHDLVKEISTKLLGYNKWYQSLCSETLIKKKQTRRTLCSHKEMDLETAQNNAVVKFPLLNQRDYDMTKLRIEQYIQLEDYALWESDLVVMMTIKKNQKTLLKQMYENFNASSSESLDSIFNRL
ncbi:hypothetical protein Tco_1245234 [Tanacetum coccineum]